MKTNNYNLILEELNKIIEEKFSTYSKYIIQERALPDVRDGLKPVQRRILYAMNQLNLTHSAQFKKSARVVGDVIGKYHPHGDTSVYEAMIRMAQEWKLRLPLVTMHGNKGSVDGDSPAAMRYTETRLAKISQLMLTHIEKQLLPFTANFDDTEIEPTVLPCKFPNLLINGATGIASGYSTNIPPHNLTEVIDALIFILKNETYTISEILSIIKGPDFPTAGNLITTTKELRNIYQEGKGRILINSVYQINNGKNEIYIKELPFEVNKADLVKKIDELINALVIPALKFVRDDSDRSGLQITLGIEKNANIPAILNYLFKHTDLQKSYNFNMVAIQDKKPALLSITELLEAFIAFQIELYTNLYTYESKVLKKKIEILTGLIRMVSIIDKVIVCIRKANDKKDSIRQLEKQFSFTALQAEAIANLRLYKLSSTDINLLNSNLIDYKKTLAHYKRLLSKQEFLKLDIVDNLEVIKTEFGSPRLTKLIKSNKVDFTYKVEDLIKNEEFFVSFSKNGYCKRVSLNSVTRSETKLGKRENDLILFAGTVLSKQKIVLFTKAGKYYIISVFNLKLFKYSEIGEHVSKFFNINDKDELVKVVIIDNMALPIRVSLATKLGKIKQFNLSNILNEYKKNGSKYITLKPEDEVIAVQFSVAEYLYYVVTVTKYGNILRYPLKLVPITSLSAAGVISIRLNENDSVIATFIEPYSSFLNNESQAILLTSDGKGKRFGLKELSIGKRAQKGKKLLKTNLKTDLRIFYLIKLLYNESLVVIDQMGKEYSIEIKKGFPIKNLSSGFKKIINSQVKLAFLSTLPFLNLNQAWVDLFLENKEQEIIENSDESLDENYKFII